MKKFIAFVFAALFAAGAWAHQYEATIDGVTWYYNKISDGKGGYNAEITYAGYYYYTYHDEYSGSLTIPSKLDGYSVTKIGADAFHNCTSLTSVTIPSGVTKIETGAFYNCTSLVVIIISNSVTAIDTNAFYNCQSLKEINGWRNGCPSDVERIVISDSVTTISSHAFYGCSSIKSVTIPDSVTTIEWGAFGGCSSIKSITIPDSVMTIDSNAFRDCSSLTSIIIPDSVVTMGEGVFSGCTSLVSATIPDKITVIGNSLFLNCCSLTSIAIPENVIAIELDAFKGCNSIRAVYITDLAKWCAISFGSFYSNPCWYAHHLYLNGDEITNLVIHDSVTTIGPYTFSGCGSIRSITLPDNITTIGSYAFYGCSSIRSVAIPNGATTIGLYAFSNCSSLTSAAIPSSVTKIASRAFSDCRSLKTIIVDANDVDRIRALLLDSGVDIDSLIFIDPLGNGGPYVEDVDGVEYTYMVSSGEATIGNGKLAAISKSTIGAIVIPSTLGGFPVTAIAQGAFEKCSSLTSVTMPENVTNIGERAFKECGKLNSIVIPECVTTVSSHAFYGCSSLTTVTIPDSVTTIGDSAFRYCSSLTSVTIPDGVTKIGEKAFSGCSSLTTVTIPDGVTKIGAYEFYNCSSLTSVTMPEGVTTIGCYAFYCCSSLTSVTIPSSVTTIGNGAFYGCSSLKEVHLTDLAKWSAISFGSSEANPCCYAHHLYLNGEEIKDLVVPDGVTAIGQYAFYGCSLLTSVTIPESVTTIRDSAFHYCSSLTSVTIPDGVTAIGRYAFYYCSSLTSVAIPDSVTTIGSWAFSGCRSLMSVTIPESVTTIRDSAFHYCSSLTSVTISEGVTSIGDSAFYYCSSLASITIPDSVTTIGSGVFYGCSSLTSIVIPDSVTTIGERAFEGCSSLTSVSIPDSVTTIGSSAFYGCRLLTSVTIPESVTTIGYDAFSGCSSLTSVTIPSNVTIASGAFSGCKLLADDNGFVIVNGVLYDYYGNLDEIEVPRNVVSIDSFGVPYSTVFKRLILHDTIKTIRTEVFRFGFIRIDELCVEDAESIRTAMRGEITANPFNVAERVIVNGEDVTERTFTVTFNPGYGYALIVDGNWWWSETPYSVTVPYGHSAEAPQVEAMDLFNDFSNWSPSIACVLEDLDVTAEFKPKDINDFLSQGYVSYDWGPIDLDEFIYDPTNAIFLAQGAVNPSLIGFIESYGNGYGKDCRFTVKVIGYRNWIPVKEHEGAVFKMGSDAYWSCCWEKDDNVDYWEISIGHTLLTGSYVVDGMYYPDTSESIKESELVIHEIPYGGFEFDSVYHGDRYNTYSYRAPAYEHVRSGEVIVLRPQQIFGHNMYWEHYNHLVNIYCSMDDCSQDCYQCNYGEVRDACPNGIYWLVPKAAEGKERDFRKITLTCSLDNGHWPYTSVENYYKDVVIDPDIYTYTVEFITGENWSYSSGDDLSYIVDEGDVVPRAPNVIVKDGWHFVGWDRDLEEPIMTNTIVRPVCAPNTYAITYENYPVALGYELPETYTYNEDCALPEIADYSFGSELPDGTKTSTFRFDGWTINGEKVDKIPAGTIGDVVVKFNSTLLVNFGDTEGPQPMPGFSHDTIVAWKGVAPTPKVMVTVEGRGELVEGQDFTVEYVDNDKVGTAKVIVRGKGDYIGTYTGSFTITKGLIVAEDERKDIFAWSPDNAVFAYDGTEKSIATIIAEDVDEVNVEVTGTTSAVNAGVYTASAKGTIKRFASDDYYNYTYVTAVDSTMTMTIRQRDLSGFSPILSGDVFFYDGAVKCPSVVVTDEGLSVELVKNRDYTVAYANNQKVGEATVTISGCGNYTGTITRQFTILNRLESLPKPTISPTSKISSGRTTITIAYAGISGYATEVRYTTDGAEPTSASTKYDKCFSIDVTTDTKVRAAAFLRDVRVSEIAEARYLPSANAVIVKSGVGCGPVTIQVGGVAPWMMDVVELGYDGTPTMRSGKIGNDSSSEMTASFTGDGVFEFSWKTSCEHDEEQEFFYDHVECLLDGEVVAQADGETPWTKVVVPVATKGDHTIVWKYVKDDGDDAEYPGEDCVWVDGVKFTFAAYIDFAADEEIVGELPERIVSASGYSITLPEIGEVKYAKHVFSGWTYGGKVYQPGDLLVVDAQEMVVKPVWTEVLEVAYDLNGGSGNIPVTQRVISGGSVNLAGIGEASLAKHSFGGWSLNGNVYAAGTGFVPQSDVLFSAVWIAKTLNMPIISVATEHDEPATAVEITAIDDEVTIYYTIDGSDPSEENGTRYEGAFEVAGSVTIKAIAIKEDYFDSEVVEATVVSTYTPIMVGFDGGEGVVGTMPSAIETALRREIVLPEIGEAHLPRHEFGGWTDGVNVYQPGDKYSIVDEICFSAVWTPKVLKTPVITVAEVYDGEKTSVVITTDDAEAEIRYTLDGSDPNMEGGLRYESSFDVVGTTTIKAIVLRDDWFDSEIVEKTTVRSWGTLNACLDNEQLVFTTGGDANWIGTSEEAYLGNTSVCSGSITHNQSSWLETKVEGAGVLTFAIKVESEYSENRGHVIIYDGLTNLVDSVAKELIGGNIEWTIKTLEIEGDGEHTIRWVYAKDDRDEEWCGRDRAWIDAIVWTQKSTRPDAVEGASEETKAAFDQWILAYKVENPSAANVNAFILGLEPSATEEAIQEKVEEELANLDLGKLAEGDISAAVAEIQAKYPNAKVDLAQVEDLNTSARLFKLVIKLK